MAQRSANVGVESSRRRCARVAIAVRQHVLGNLGDEVPFTVARRCKERGAEAARRGAPNRKVIRRREVLEIFERGSKDIASTADERRSSSSPGNVTRKSRARGCEPTEVTAAGCRKTVESRRHGGEREREAPKGAARIVDTEVNVEGCSLEVDGFMVAARRS